MSIISLCVLYGCRPRLVKVWPVTLYVYDRRECDRFCFNLKNKSIEIETFPLLAERIFEALK